MIRNFCTVKYGHIILGISFLVIINIFQFSKEKKSNTAVNEKYSDYESIEQRMKRLNNFCDSLPPSSAIRDNYAKNQYITSYLNTTGDLICLNPKTGSTSLTTLLYLMTVANVSASSLTSLSSG